MNEVRGREAVPTDLIKGEDRCQYVIFETEEIDLKAGDEVLLIVEKPPDSKHKEYGIPLRVTEKKAAEEDEIVLRHGDRLFVAQKIPEFI